MHKELIFDKDYIDIPMIYILALKEKSLDIFNIIGIANSFSSYKRLQPNIILRDVS